VNARPDLGPGRFGRLLGHVKAGRDPAASCAGIAAQGAQVRDLERADNRHGRLAVCQREIIGPQQARLGIVQSPLHQRGPADLEQCQRCLIGAQRSR